MNKFPRMGAPRALIVLAAISVGGLGYGIAQKPWQPLQVDEGWCENVILRAQPLITACQRYERRTGHFPKTLDELVPPDLTTLSSPVIPPRGNGRQRWRYHRRSHGGFQLSVTTLHWVSSFDALVYRSSRDYHKLLESHDGAFRMGDWVYIIGAQNIDFSGGSWRHASGT